MISIRRFESADQTQVQELVTSIMDKEFHEDRAAYPTDDLQNISQTYGHIGEAFFVALDGSRLVGTVAVKKEDDRIALMRRLFVSPEYRNRQIGMKLIDRVTQFCSEVGYRELVFKTTSRMEGAIRTCKKRGFVPRAKIHLGPIELLKFSLSLRDGIKQTTPS